MEFGGSEDKMMLVGVIPTIVATLERKVLNVIDVCESIGQAHIRVKKYEDVHTFQ